LKRYKSDKKMTSSVTPKISASILIFLFYNFLKNYIFIS
jgi:hypothetical protein